MRKVTVLFIAVASLAATISFAAIETTSLSTDLMQSIEDTNKSLSSNISLNDVAASTADAKELTTMFAQVETYFVQKGDAPDAVELAQKSKNLTIEIAQAVAAKDFEKATNAATNVSRNCRTCHTFYKKE
ncbi:hypothetical protein [Sapientia aquatica]|uniref:Cytochrome c n=1 Tax=Sapientia aquatica TaxID=1549640 RepID=A0A4R5W4G8_9BURK|nr:hypothetical protein [Sapientia aquatica]TDK66479.1 hypothetical protein E2I14_08400 [Sapientia aquatica]